MLTRADCNFYQSVELPGGEVIDGPWDLRGRELEYLGGIDLAGRRVLELGPATGALTYFMEREGADVVSFDVGYDVSIDLYPAPGNADTRKLRLDHARKTSEVQNSWWYLHRAYGSSARMVYGDFYALPGDLGEYNVSVFAATLLHLRSPVAALEEAARRTRETIVVTEPWAFGRDSMLDNVDADLSVRRVRAVDPLVEHLRRRGGADARHDGLPRSARDRAHATPPLRCTSPTRPTTTSTCTRWSRTAHGEHGTRQMRTSARSIGSSLAWVSAHSASAREPATMPAPACSRARAPSICAPRSATTNSPSPRASTHPHGPA